MHVLNYSKATTELHRLIKAHATTTILSNVVFVPDPLLMKSTGTVEFRSVYFCLMFRMTLSTCMRTLAIRHVCSTSMAHNCFLPLVNAGTVIVAQYCPTDSLISKPRSAKMVSPGIKLLSSPQFSVRCLSLTLPPSFRYEAYGSLWCNTNKIFNCVMVLVR